MLIVNHVARATTTAVRYDTSLWLKPLFVPDNLKHAWLIDQRAQLLQYLIQWATWREEEAWRAAQEIGASKLLRKGKVRQQAWATSRLRRGKTLLQVGNSRLTGCQERYASGPIGADSWLIDGGTWDLEPAKGDKKDDIVLRRRQTVALLEKAELEGSETLRYVLGHHFPALLEPYLRHAL